MLTGLPGDNDLLRYVKYVAFPGQKPFHSLLTAQLLGKTPSAANASPAVDSHLLTSGVELQLGGRSVPLAAVCPRAATRDELKSGSPTRAACCHCIENFV